MGKTLESARRFDEVNFQMTRFINLGHLDVRVRHKITLEYVRDKDLKKPLKPLFMTPARGLVLMEGDNAYYNVKTPDMVNHGPGCSLGESAGKKASLLMPMAKDLPAVGL